MSFGILPVLLFFFIVAAFVVWQITRSRRSHKQRTESAQALGFTRVENPSQAVQQHIFAVFQDRTPGKLKLTDLYHRPFPDGDIYIFDISAEGSDSNSILMQGGVAFISDQLTLPPFRIWPKPKSIPFVNQLVEWVMARNTQKVTFHGSPDFENQFLVTSQHPAAAQEFIDPILQQVILGEPEYILVGAGNTLVCDLPEQQYAQKTQNQSLSKQTDDQDQLDQILRVGQKFFAHFSDASLAPDREMPVERVRDQGHALRLIDCPSCGREQALPSTEDELLTCQYCGAPLETLAPAPSSVSVPPLLSKLEGSARVLESCMPIGFGLVWTAFSLFFVFMSLRVYTQEKEVHTLLSTEGIEIQGIITDLSIYTDSDDDDTCAVTYEYQAPITGDPTRFSAQQSIPCDRYAGLEAGQPIDILYAASEPAVSEVKSNFTSTSPPPTGVLCGAGMGLLFTVIGLLIIFSGVSASRKKKDRSVSS